MVRHILTLSLALWPLVATQTPPSPARYYNPRFSADGVSVIFESTRDGKMAVYSIKTDGTGLRRITDAQQNDAQPQWSVDGRMITFTSDTSGLNKVFVMTADGRDRRAISTGPKHDAAPAFSSDGQKVVWAATTVLPEDWRDLGVASTDGSSGQKLITSGPGNDQAPVWISSSKIVFVREFPPKTSWPAMTPEDHAKRRASSEIMAVNADGTGLENLTKNTFSDSNPTWAASMKRIFFTSDRDGTPALYSMNADGSDVKRVGDTSGSVSADGRFITYSKVVDGKSGIFVRDLSSGAERELVSGS
jgi:TolB protein